MTLSHALWPEPSAHKLHICTMAEPWAGSSLTWHGLPISILAYMSLKDILIKEIKYQPQTLKYNLDPMEKIIRGSQSSISMRTVYYITGTERTKTKDLNGETRSLPNQDSKELSRAPKACWVLGLFTIYTLAYIQKGLRTAYHKNIKIYMNHWGEKNQKLNRKERDGAQFLFFQVH